MSAPDAPAVPVWPYVLVWTGVKLVFVGVVLIDMLSPDISLNTDALNPNILNVLGFGAALGWYAYKIDRPMQLREMILFSSGAVLVDLILSFSVVAGYIVLQGEDLSLRNVSFALGGDGTYDISMALFIAVFTELLTFLQGMFFAWIFTRKLPRRRKAG